VVEEDSVVEKELKEKDVASDVAVAEEIEETEAIEEVVDVETVVLAAERRMGKAHGSLLPNLVA